MLVLVVVVVAAVAAVGMRHIVVGIVVAVVVAECIVVRCIAGDVVVVAAAGCIVAMEGRHTVRAPHIEDRTVPRWGVVGVEHVHTHQLVGYKAVDGAVGKDMS